MSKNFYKIITASVLTAIFACSTIINAQTGWYPLQSGTSTILNSVFFVNAEIGYMSGNGIMLKTTNGGTNWLVITKSFGGSSVYFTNENTGYVADGTIYKTTDGGLTWNNLNLSSLISVTFANESTGYAVGYNSLILKTTNAGSSWEYQFVSIYENKFNSVIFRGPNFGFIAGGKMSEPFSGVIYKTVNGGDSWYPVYPNSADIDFRSISFPSKDTGYVVGGYEFGSSGVIYKSINTGESWSQIGIVNKDLNSVQFLSNVIGYTVGEDGTILKTTNGSTVWSSQVSTTDKDLNSVCFLHPDLGFSAGGSGSVQKTINGGVYGPPFAISGRVVHTNGTPVTKGIVKALKYDRLLNSVVVIDTAGIQSNGNYIIRNVSNDTVDIMVFPNDEDLDNPPPPKFVPTYYAGDYDGTIYWASSNSFYVNNNVFNINVKVFSTTGTGGDNFISGGVFVAPPAVSGLKDAIVYAIDLNTSEFKGYSVSRTGGPYDVNNIPPSSYRMICDRMGYFSAERNVTLGSVNLDTINFYLTGVSVIGIEPIGNNIPSEFKLGQNYPNPFNPSTSIEFSVPKKSLSQESEVRLAVYDMLGREIEVLLNNKLQPGNYRVSWNASKYSSGIYFYRIISKEFTDTRKMILIK